jgi:hypothetical protein
MKITGGIVTLDTSMRTRGQQTFRSGKDFLNLGQALIFLLPLDLV